MILQSLQLFASTAELSLLDLVPDAGISGSDLSWHREIGLVLGKRWFVILQMELNDFKLFTRNSSSMISE